MNWFTTNKQLRNDVKRLTKAIELFHALIDNQNREVVARDQQIRALRNERDALTRSKAPAILKKAPTSPVVRPKQPRAPYPTAAQPTSPYPTVRKEDESNSVNSFLAGAAIGVVIDEVFRAYDSSSSDSSGSSSSSDSFSSGDGGSFGGGGASSEW